MGTQGQRLTKIKQNSSKVHVLLSSELSVKKITKKPPVHNFSTWIRVLFQNWRQGTVSVKGRSDVARSGKKPWKQKGTGRARAGTARSPIWRGGGVTFGPQARVKELRISKKMRHGIIGFILYNYLDNGRMIQLKWGDDLNAPQTKQAYELLREAGTIDCKKLIMLVSFYDRVIQDSFANIPNVKILFFDQLNAFELIGADYLIFFEKDVKAFKEMMLQWI